ncbi:MAG: ABC transporter ATP-binding protein [Spirochaetaceae bacterium]|jgi:lipoprotein-releasing system ATP-binding protein|nr:ABC transporter ATP-binding protein [Spirochaetaceae bacterium]
MAEPLLKVNNVVKNYLSGTETLYILKNLTFAVPQGSSVAISGQSGSGKSTLLNILGGLDRCDSGTVTIAGTEITRLSESALSAYRSKRVGFIFQFHYLLKDFTALENVMIPAYIAGLKKKDALEKAATLLTEVKMQDRMTHYPSQLSGGERQRVAVARSMINNPDLILADEPTGNLDSHNSAMVAQLLYTEAERRNKTLIVVTHDETIAAQALYRYTLNAGVFTRTD